MDSNDESTTYVGYGNGAACGNQVQAPCSLTSTGCLIPCGSKVISDLKTPHYLLKNDALTWVPTTSALVSSVPNTLKIPGPHNLMFGRAVIDGANALGKILSASDGTYTFQTATRSGAVKLTSAFEVLTCDKVCSMYQVG